MSPASCQLLHPAIMNNKETLCAYAQVYHVCTVAKAPTAMTMA